jgi:hypothetical protein
MARGDLLKGVVLGAIVSTIILLGTAAVAGTGIGGVFNLGKTNAVNAQSALKGSTGAENLKITNTGSGGGLGITVGAGKAPISVNASAGVAKNLNAAKVGGLTVRQFSVLVATNTSTPQTVLKLDGLTLELACDASGQPTFTATSAVGGALIEGGFNTYVNGSTTPGPPSATAGTPYTLISESDGGGAGTFTYQQPNGGHHVGVYVNVDDTITLNGFDGCSAIGVAIAH